MEFNFNINNYFKEEIVKVGSRLIPDGFIGDRREVQDCLSKVSYILTVLGEKSAKAQGLQKVITSGEKLRNSDHVVYILIDPKGGPKGLGAVLGMLKMGLKHLYVFDASGNTHEVTAKCVLDFYVHESKQRMGLGKKLFQHMLKEERVDPVHLAIDKPSSKFLSFLLKHYGLQKIIPQMNNFVVFDGFFSSRSYGNQGEWPAPGAAELNREDSEGKIGASLETRYSSGSTNLTQSPTKPHQYQSVSSINVNNTSYYGRQAPHKPVSTMGMILQQKPPPSQQSTSNGSPTEKQAEAEASVPLVEEVVENEENVPQIELTMEKEEKMPETNENENTETLSVPETPAQENQPEDSAPEEGTKVSTPVTPTESLKSPSEVPQEKIRVNSQGYMDLKFYHASLW